MGTLVITSATGTRDTATIVNGNGAPANNWIYLTEDDHDTEFRRGLSDRCGNFSISAGNRPSDVYDFVVTALDCNGTVGDNTGWSKPFHFKIY